MAAVKLFRQAWGAPAGIAAFAPDQAGEPGFYEWSAHVQRCSATPRAVAAQLTAAMTGDVRQALPLIHASTVVSHRSPAYQWVPQAMGRTWPSTSGGRRFANWASRCASASTPARSSEVLVSGTVKDLVVGSGIAFTDRGAHELKGVPGNWPVFAVQQ